MSTSPIHIKQVPPRVVVTERHPHANVANLNTVMQSSLTKIATSVAPAGAVRGAPFAMYHNEPFNPSDIDIEIGIPVASDSIKVDESKGAHRRMLDGGPVAYTIHTGPYQEIGAAYGALYTWLAQHGHKRVGPPCETYLVAPGQGVQPEDLRTEIDVPID